MFVLLKHNPKNGFEWANNSLGLLLCGCCILCLLLGVGCGKGTEDKSVSVDRTAGGEQRAGSLQSGAEGDRTSLPTVRTGVNSVLGKVTVKNFSHPPWRLEARRVDWQGKGKGVAVGVVWHLLSDSGKEGVRVTSSNAKFDLESGIVVFRDKVKAVRDISGDRLTVNRLVWKGKEGKFYGSYGVRWTRGGYSLRADNVVADGRLRHVVLTGKVYGAVVKGEGE